MISVKTLDPLSINKLMVFPVCTYVWTPCEIFSVLSSHCIFPFPFPHSSHLHGSKQSREEEEGSRSNRKIFFRSLCLKRPELISRGAKRGHLGQSSGEREPRTRRVPWPEE